jgi:hypothetical protein
MKEENMTDTIRIFGANTPERQRLEAAATLINSYFDHNNATARVTDEWFDYEGGVMWTTIMVGQYPALNPLQQARLISDDFEDFARTVAAVVETHRARMNMLLGVRYGLQEEK